jgi:uncharacterized protein DUF6455
MFAKIIVVLIFFMFAIIALKLVLEISRNIKTGKRFREQLKERLDQLPIIKMLDKRNIDVNKYLSTIPIIDIEKQLHNCNECSEKAECKGVLEKEATSEASYSFCPNDEDFEQIKRSEDLSNIEK